MLKRILVVAGGVTLGLSVAFFATRLALLWGLLPGREVDRDAGYFREVLQVVHANYVDPAAATYDKLTTAALKGMVQSLDAHSEFMTARDYKDLQEQISNAFGGIGVRVEMRDGRVTVIAPIAHTPAERAGLRRGDQIVAVDGHPLAKLGMDKIVDRLRGKPGTKVRVGVFRPADQRDLEFDLVRAIIKVASVQGVRMLPHGIGYLEIDEFSERTGAEFLAALKRLRAEGMTALVIDLRDNPGGLLDAAVAVADPLFRPGDLIVYTQGNTPDSREDYTADTGEKFASLPIAVLVNSGTASAAEIVSGALKDTGRAVIVGERTFGKGLVQSIIELKDGQGLRLTTAKYYTPGGVSIQGKGIEPQVPVVLSDEDDGRLQLERLRSDLTDPKAFEERFGFAPIPDPQLAAAEDVLRGVELLRARAPAAR